MFLSVLEVTSLVVCRIAHEAITYWTTMLSATPHNHFDDPILKAVSVAAFQALSAKDTREDEWVAGVERSWDDIAARTRRKRNQSHLGQRCFI